MNIKPVGGKSVPDPERGGILPPEGRNVEPSSYWLRRIEDGDVVEVPAESETQAKPTTTPSRKKEEA